MKTLLISQGCGFYGSAIMTTGLSSQQVAAKLKKAGWKILPSTPLSRGEISIKKLGVAPMPEDNHFAVLFGDNHGDISAPKPALVFDSGHGYQDLKILEKIKEVL
jgi:hypothetical protein